MKGADVRLARERLGVSPGALATRMGVPAQTIRSWEGLERVPRGVRRRAEWALWTLERETVLAGSGLAECPFETGWSAQAEPDGSALWTHRQACALCRERDAFAVARLARRPPYPARGWLFRHLSELEGWASAAAHGVVGTLLAGGAAVLFLASRSVDVEPEAGLDPVLAVWAVLPLAVLLAGAVAGVVWHASRHHRVSRRDEVRTGVVSASAGVLVLAMLPLLAARVAGLRLEPVSETVLSLAAVLLAGAAGFALGPAVRAERAMRVAAERGRGFPRRRVEKMCLWSSVVVVGVVLAAADHVHWIPREVDRLHARAVQAGDTALVWRLDSVRRSPWDPVAHSMAGDALMERRRWEEAAESFERAVRLEDGRYSEAWINLGLARQRLGRRSAALEAARKAVEVALTRAEGDYAMALVLFEGGAYPAALGHARKAAAHPFARPQHWLALARIARATGHEEEARQALERVRESAPDLLASEGAELDRIVRRAGKP